MFAPAPVVRREMFGAVMLPGDEMELCEVTLTCPSAPQVATAAVTPTPPFVEVKLTIFDVILAATFKSPKDDNVVVFKHPEPQLTVPLTFSGPFGTVSWNTPLLPA